MSDTERSSYLPRGYVNLRPYASISFRSVFQAIPTGARKCRESRWSCQPSLPHQPASHCHRVGLLDDCSLVFSYT